MHAVLIAKALSLPAWMQLLHPVATVIAKTKLLVLPVYPAAWPQAKQHPAMQALIRFWNYLAAHYLARKTAYRYRQTETVAAHAGDALRHTAAATGLEPARQRRARRRSMQPRPGRAERPGRIMARIVAMLSRFPMFGGIVQRYTAHYDEANRTPAAKFSDKTRGFFQRWSVKFTAEYYETKEREEAAKGAAGA